MIYQIILVFILTVIIHFINTLAYSVRIVGVRTGKIAVSFALFNIVVLVSRIANTIQAPLLAKTVENSLSLGTSAELLVIFRYVLLATTLGSILAAFFVPTFQRMYCKAVNSFNVCRSVPKLLLYSFSKAGIRQFRGNIKVPSKHNITKLRKLNQIPFRITILNMLAVALLSVGVLSALYAGILAPEFRTTSITLSSVITGFATVILFVFIDPHLSIMTDDVIEGKKSEGAFRTTVMFMIIGRILGTLIAQIFFVPAARVIAFIATEIL
jgi:hypothetical protein